MTPIWNIIKTLSLEIYIDPISTEEEVIYLGVQMNSLSYFETTEPYQRFLQIAASYAEIQYPNSSENWATLLWIADQTPSRFQLHFFIR